MTENKKKLELKPEFEYNDKFEQLKTILEQEKNSEIEEAKTNVNIDKVKNIYNSNLMELSDKNNDSESLFASVVEDLRSPVNLSAKTEFMDNKEVFVISKMDFLGNAFDFPALRKFTQIFKYNRISLQRKGRKEIIMAMTERRQEIERENRILSRDNGVRI